jgi:hypothetical protein
MIDRITPTSQNKLNKYRKSILKEMQSLMDKAEANKGEWAFRFDGMMPANINLYNHSEWFEDRSSDYFEKVVDEFVADVKDVIDEPMRTELIDKMIHIPYEDL